MVYFSYKSGPCGGNVACNFRGIIPVPAGFDTVEVFLSGFRLQTATMSDMVSSVGATVQKYRYNVTTGDLEVGVTSWLRTQSGQQYSYLLTFAVLLTNPGVAHLTPISTGCSGLGECHIVRSLPTAVPAGMHYIGLATSNWHLGASSGAIPLHVLSGHLDNLTLIGPAVNVDYRCAMHDTQLNTKMYCEWGAKVLAFDSSEMAQNGSLLFPQYTVIGFNTPSRHSWIEHAPNPSGNPLPGFFDALEGLSLVYAGTSQHPVWWIEGSATGFSVAGSTALTRYGIFLGTQFGNSTTAAPYGYQMSRAFGFLR